MRYEKFNRLISRLDSSPALGIQNSAKREVVENTFQNERTSTCQAERVSCESPTTGSRGSRRSAQRRIFISSHRQFDSTQLVIRASAQNSLLFKCLSGERASFIVKNILQSKKCALAAFFIAFASVMANLIYNYSALGSVVDDQQHTIVANLMRLPATLIVLVFPAGYCLSVDNTIFLLIVSTFDFWYKVSNLCVGLVSFWVLHEHLFSTVTIPFYSLSTLVLVALYLAFFLIDGVVLPQRVKNVSIVLYCSWGFSQVGYDYLYIEDVTWDPIGDDFTQISFKTLYLSSFLTANLFIAKPLLTMILTRMKNRICRRNRNACSGMRNEAARSTDILRGYCVYKYSHVRWS